ncbi:MAG: lamin tail domain-containing protein [Sedimentisphaerales bacterium]
MKKNLIKRTKRGRGRPMCLPWATARGCPYFFVVILFIGLAAGTTRSEWVAYNDNLREAGDSTAANVTGWTIHNNDSVHSTGRLKNFETASEASMPTVTFTMGNAGLSVSSGSSGGNPTQGTEAYEIFNNIVDFGPNLVYYGSSGWWVEIEFTGLDPAKTYSFVGTAVRSRMYPSRITLFTISNAVSYVNNSSDGIVERSGNESKLLAGNNSVTGYVIRWDEIVPSAGGSFKIRAEAAPEAEDGRAYPFGGFMLEELGKAGNRPPEVDAGDYYSLTWPNNSLQLSPIIEDDDPCDVGILTIKWSKLSGPGTVTFEPGDNIADPCAIFSEPGDYALQLQVWDEVPQFQSSSVIITIIEPLLGDLNGNNKVNWQDLVLFAAQWLGPQRSPADLNARDGVNMADFAILAENWREGEGAILVINELLARNDLGITDPQGERDDWIEIYNSGEEAINIGGMYLTDDLSEPAKWRVPNENPSDTTISPGGYLLIWADNDTTDAGFHASFELGADAGEEIGLFDTDGTTLLDSVTFGDQTPDVSYGRDPDATSNLVTLHPTPGASNNGSYLAVVADTKFSHDRGFYNAPFDMQITCETPGAMIRYTTDGSTPTTSHGVYYNPASPIRIITTTCLRAMAFLPGWKSTNVDTHTYIFLDDVIKQATNAVTGSQVAPSGYPSSWGSVTGDYQVDPDVVGQNGRDRFDGLYANTIIDDLKSAPTISLVMDKDDWFGSRGIYINQSQDGTERVASIEYIDPNTKDEFQVNCAIAMQGGVSGGGTSLNRWKSFKLSMRPRFKTQTDDLKATGGPPKLNFKLFADSPVDRHNTFVLDGVLNHSWLHPGSDQTNTALYVQDQYVADLHNAMGGHSPHGSYAHIYINGLYWGMYYIHERPDHAWAAEMFGGDEDDYDAIKHNSGNVINNGIGGSATANYNSMVSAANTVQSDPTNLAKYNTLTQKLDVDNFITYLLANWFCGNHDWPHKNWYATHHNYSDGRWRFHSWDAEHTVEGGNDVGESPSDIHNKLDGNADYRMRFADHVHRHFFNGGPLSYPASAQLFQARMNQLDRTIVGESARWGDNRRSTPYTREDWLKTAEGKLNSFLPGRSNSVLNSLKSANLYPRVDAPVFSINGVNQHGGHVDTNSRLSMSASGTIWFSLSGADPRLPGGAVNRSEASAYTGPVTLTKSTHVQARVSSGSTWSALNEAVFAVGPVAENLRITEIMYNPSRVEGVPPSDRGQDARDTTEFIELKNIGAETINLNYVSFTNGIDITIPDVDLAPDQYILVVEDMNAFTNKYGPALNIAGDYSGSLNNAGERIELLDAAGLTIHNFKYSDNWFTITDGMDFSLVVIDPLNTDPIAWGDKSTWRPSTGPGGSPGTDNAGQAPEIGGVIINEILAHSHAEAPDWIELYNTNGHAVNIGGWFLSDGEQDLKKYEIPDTTIMEPYGYIVFYEDLHFGNASSSLGMKEPFFTLSGVEGFGLSENGETLYLYSGSGGELTGYSDIEKFGASETGVSFGRYLKSTGSYNFVAMSENTPGGDNAYPKVGPLVINEIMYNPPSAEGVPPSDRGQDARDTEYDALLNISDSPVVLYDPVTGEPWRFTDDPDNPGIEFFFPTDSPVTLEPGEHLLLVSDWTALATRYSIPAGVQVFEWDTGKLDNAGEKIQLSMPGDADTQGLRQWIRVDRVNYSDGSHPDDTPGDTDPWPVEPDGIGYSLSRINPAEYGNDPVNWQAEIPSPGRENP